MGDPRIPQYRHPTMEGSTGIDARKRRARQKKAQRGGNGWRGLTGALGRGERDVMAGYSGTPLVQKLGTREAPRAGHVGAPHSVAEALVLLPGVVLRIQALGSDRPRHPSQVR